MLMPLCVCMIVVWRCDLLIALTCVSQTDLDCYVCSMTLLCVVFAFHLNVALLLCATGCVGIGCVFVLIVLFDVTCAS